MPTKTTLPGLPGTNERWEAILLRYEQIICWRDAGYTLEVIGKRFGICKEQVRQNEDRYRRHGPGGRSYIYASRKV